MPTTAVTRLLHARPLLRKGSGIAGVLFNHLVDTGE
jgi:hypothetical protein